MNSTGTVIIREATEHDLADILNVEQEAFRSEIEPALVRDLIADPSAQPVVSLVAVVGSRAVGHILFTKARLERFSSAHASLLAPMAVIPEMQKRGIGSRLATAGVKVLSERGVELVFVLGHPAYYPRFGFSPALPQGYEPPHAISEEQADAWMVMGLTKDAVGSYSGRVLCADVIQKPEYWRE